MGVDSKALANYEEQADAIAQVLQNLGITECAIMAMSGGGPTCLQFATRHPSICKALIMEAAVTGNTAHKKAAQL